MRARYDYARRADVVYCGLFHDPDRPVIMREYFYVLMRSYLSLFLLLQNTAVEIDPLNALLGAVLPNGEVA